MNPVLKFVRSRTAERIGLLVVLLCSLGLALWSGSTLRYFDESDYNNLAHSLIRQHVYALAGHPSMYWPPGYPFFLAGVYQLLDNPVAGKVANCLALVASVHLITRLSARLRTSPGALVPLVTLCYPLFLYTASTLYPQSMGGLLMLSSIVLVSGPGHRTGRLLAAGLVLGALCLMIPSFLYIAPLLALYVMWRQRLAPKRMVFCAMILSLSAAVVIAPWTIRNKLVLGHAVLVSANGGTNLAIGNSAFTPPNGKTDLATACPDVPYDPDEAVLDHALAGCALHWMHANPGPALRLYLEKALNYFNYRNDLSTGEQKLWQQWLVFATYYPLLGIALLRLAFWRRYRLTDTEVLLYAVYFVNGLLTAIFFTRLRFRVPFDLLLVAIDTAFVMYLLGAPPASTRTVSEATSPAVI